MAWNTPLNSSDKLQLVYKKPTIQVLLPHRGQWSAEFVEATWKPLCMVPLDWCVKTFSLCRIPSLPVARNTLVEEFLKTDADYALWVDSDEIVDKPSIKLKNPDGADVEMGDPNLALFHLYKALKESEAKDDKIGIVTGLYRAKQAHGFNYAIWKQAERPEGGIGFVHIQKWEPPEANFFSVDVAGMGFMLMSRKVLTAMKGAGYGTKEKPFFHWEAPGDISEDFDMLLKARELGYETWCLTDVKLSHIGELVIDVEGKVRVPRI